MTFRGMQLLVVIFWLASMSWLIGTKIMPALVGGDPPDYQSRLREPPEEPDCWRIKWNERTIGYAASQVVRSEEGDPLLRNLVHFEELPLDSMVRQMFGPMSLLIRPFFGGRGQLDVEMLVATQITYDAEQRPRQLRSVIDVNHLQGLLEVEGVLDESNIFGVQARLSRDVLSGGDSERVFRHSLRLPPEVLLSDSMSPRAELRELHIGQTWTVPVYRAFPPNQPVQLVQATVERHEIIFWEGTDVETFLVVYRSDSGAEIQATRGTLGKEWVRSDGTILRQEVSLAGMPIQFERLGDPWRNPRIDWLDADAHPRLWKQSEQ